MARINVRGLRTSMGKTIDDFSRAIGVHPRTIQRWEAAHTDPSPMAAQRLRELMQPTARRKDFTPPPAEDPHA